MTCQICDCGGGGDRVMSINDQIRLNSYFLLFKLKNKLKNSIKKGCNKLFQQIEMFGDLLT